MLLKNKEMCVTVTEYGATIESIQKDGKEYFWQKEPSVWDLSDLVMFPFVARLPEETYWFDGKKYRLPIHGFCVGTTFAVEEQTDTKVVFSLVSTEETMKIYPFPFRFFVTYELDGTTLTKRYRVENTGEATMYFGIGSHPGLCLPSAPFSSWKLTFSTKCAPTQHLVDQETLLMAGKTAPFSLAQGQELSLSHELFRDDVIILENMAPEVLLHSPDTDEKITVRYPDCPYLGLWQVPKDGADYICIEPWYSLPAVVGETVDLAKKPDLLSLAPGSIYENTMEISIA